MITFLFTMATFTIILSTWCSYNYLESGKGIYLVLTIVSIILFATNVINISSIIESPQHQTDCK